MMFMITIPLTTQEFDDFKKLACFWFDCKWANPFVYVTANAEHLEKLGYL